MKILVFIPFLLLGILAMRGMRLAYVSFVVFGLLYFPASVQFRVEPKRCELTFDLTAAVQSLSNYGHIISFFVFFLITAAQFRQRRWQSLVWSVVLTMVMGVAVEIAEGLSGAHHCKTLDLIPDLAGALLGLIAVLLG
jgi:VanZ family protein